MPKIDQTGASVPGDLSQPHRFSIGAANQDLILTLGEEVCNLGYNYVSKLPFTLWLAGLQTQQGNFFKDAGIQEPTGLASVVQCLGGEQGSPSETLLELARKLPLSPQDFTAELSIAGYGRFTGGSNKIHYSFRLAEDKLLFLERKSPSQPAPVPIMQLSPIELHPFFNIYLQFLKEESILQVPYFQIARFSRSLRSVP